MERARIARHIAPVVLALTSTLASAAAQQSTSAVPIRHLPDEPQRHSPAAPPDRRGGPHEGLTVHGHWTLEVRNPDGSVAGRYEFENSLAQGSDVLPVLLTGQKMPGAWEIQVLGNAGICPASSTCLTTNFPPTSNPGTDLVVSQVPATANSRAALSFTGSVKVSGNGQIVQVATVLHSCSPGTFAATCLADPTATSATFTARDLTGSPVSVGAGQTVLITVAITLT